MVVVAMDTHTFLKLGDGSSIHLEAIVKLLGLDPEFGCKAG